MGVVGRCWSPGCGLRRGWRRGVHGVSGGVRAMTAVPSRVGGSDALCEAGAGEIVDPGWSGCQGQLIEGGRHPQRCGFFDSEFVVAAADVLDKRVPGADHLCAAESCQAAHRP